MQTVSIRLLLISMIFLVSNLNVYALQPRLNDLKMSQINLKTKLEKLNKSLKKLKSNLEGKKERHDKARLQKEQEEAQRKDEAARKLAAEVNLGKVDIAKLSNTPEFNQLIETATKLVTANSGAQQEQGLMLFRLLFEKGSQGAFGPEALKVATTNAAELIESDNESQRHTGRELYRLLFEKQYEPAFISAVRIVKTLMKSDRNKQNSGLILADRLLEQDINKAQGAFLMISDVAKELALSETFRNQEVGYTLFIKLLEKGFKQAFKEAKDVADLQKDSQSIMERRLSWNLYTALIKYGTDEALENKLLKDATTLVKSERWQDQLAGLNLLIELVKKNYDQLLRDGHLEMAANAAQKAIDDGLEKSKKTSGRRMVNDVEAAGFYLLIELIKKGYKDVFKSGTIAAEQATNSNSSLLQEIGLSLFIALVEQQHGEAIKNASEAATKLMGSGDSSIKKMATELQNKLKKS